jgi:hypothetical protein
MDARFACNFKDARNFVIAVHFLELPSSQDAVAVQHWLCKALSTHCCSHAAAYDTYSRKEFAWDVRVENRQSCMEVWVLIRLRWEGRRFMDSDNLVFVSDYPRPAPVMNASEIWRALSHSVFCIPKGVESCGVSGVSNKVFASYWDRARRLPTLQLCPVSYAWKERGHKERGHKECGHKVNQSWPDIAPSLVDEEWEEPV